VKRSIAFSGIVAVNGVGVRVAGDRKLPMVRVTVAVGGNVRAVYSERELHERSVANESGR
jgi:hypothetical protein